MKNLGGGIRHGKAWLFNKGGVEICLNIERGKRVLWEFVIAYQTLFCITLLFGWKCINSNCSNVFK